MNIDDYDRQILYYEKRCNLYSILTYRLIESFSFKTHSWYRSGRITKAVQQFYKTLNLKKKDSLIEYLNSLYKDGEIESKLESYKWDKLIKEIYSVSGEPIDNSELYKLSSDFSVAPVASLDKMLQDYKYFMDRIENLQQQKKELLKNEPVKEDGDTKQTTNTSYTKILGEVEDKIGNIGIKEEIKQIEESDMSIVDKANEILKNRSRLTDNYSTTYDFVEAIKNVLNCNSTIEKNSVGSQIELLFTLDKLKKSNDVVWLKELADKTVEIMILYVESKVCSDNLSEDVEQFLNGNGFGKNIQTYNNEYEQYKNDSLTEDEKKKIIKPEQLLKILNTRLSKIVKEHISLIPEDCDKNIQTISIITQYMNIDDITKVYVDIINNEISDNDDSYDYQEAKDLLQYIFASVIVKKMDSLNDLLTEQEIKEEEIKRKSSVCVDYFHEIPSVLIDSQGVYTNLEGYAKEKLKDAKLVNEQMAKYYNESNFKHSLSIMNFSSLAKIINKGATNNE